MSNNPVKNTFEIYDLLRSGLMYPSIVFIPMNMVLEHVEFKEIEELQKILQPFDTLWICESLEINYPLEEDTNLMLLLKKQDLLKTNLFNLMDYKQNLESEQFLHLENKYKQLLYVCMYFSQEMVKVIKDLKEEHFAKYLNLFELQDFHYQKHFYEIEESFPTSEEEKKTWHREENIDDENLAGNNVASDNLPSERNKKVKKRKQKNITDVESQKYLLETVFNIKTD